VYHSRQSSEHGALRQRIDRALTNAESRLEVDMVRKTLADVHRQEGRDEGRREGALAVSKRTLLGQLRQRWAPLPAETEQTIEATQDVNQLEQWLLRFATALDLDSIGIRPPR
jgi:hypothetical protein